jgi:hypothetical protein
MSNYIDADKLKKLIDKKWKELADKNVKAGGGVWDIEISTYLSVLGLIESLEQERPEVEINLGNEVENFCLEYDARKDAWYNMTPQDQKLLSNPTWLNFATNIARHFYELGLNARKEESK